ncbi:MAG: UDP-N-acetylmuramate--L-alanine ligase [Candidatus Omnitrophota bacterium]|nr:MAG: UDP-N-acetylmuramate--L-alanine ligase [Candidatus Omnitrophota bacterium]
MSTHYHLIGIGGIGMSGIARLLFCGRCNVTGSDAKQSKITEELNALGIKVYIGHEASYVRGADYVVYSSAIKADNPEIEEARKRRIPLLKRAEALAQLMADKRVVTVTGSHGKTTTTSMIAYLMLEAGLFPTIAVGGILKNIDTNACPGKGDFFVAEADESDGSFLFYRPRYSIITNIDYEHLDFYGNFENELAAFREFIERTEEEGCLICGGDDKHLKKLVENSRRQHIFFGLNEKTGIHARNISITGLSSEFDCFLNDTLIGHFRLSLGGAHNISNALSVIALGMELKIDIGTIQKALFNYQGSGRRLEVKFYEDNMRLIDDYAHHPTEIKATLEAVAHLNAKRKIVIFQPHRYSRTKLLLELFGRCFAAADYLIITDIYAASETPIEGISGKKVYETIKEFEPAKEAYFLKKEEIARHVLKIARAGDVIVTLGAGDISKVSDELVQGLRAKLQVPRTA